MKTIKKITSLSGLLGLLVCGGLTAAGPQTAKHQSFDWAGRPGLTPDQEKLLHLYKAWDSAPADSVKRQSLKKEIDCLAAKLGSSAVRPARPGELIVSRKGPAGHATIYNPSEANLALTVAIKGDEEWIGSRKASMGRQTFLPPKAVLIVTNLYWTTPRMTDRK